MTMPNTFSIADRETTTIELSLSDVGVAPDYVVDYELDIESFRIDKQSLSVTTNRQDSSTDSDEYRDPPLGADQDPCTPRQRRMSCSPPPDADPDDSVQRPAAKKRKNFCPFCEKIVSNFSRHFVTHHADKEPVKEYIALLQKTPRTRRLQRAIITNRIRNIGNSTYNTQIVEGKRESEYLPFKRSSNNKYSVDNVSHVVCRHCFGFFKKASLYRHVRKCKEQAGVETEPPAPPTNCKRNTVLPDHSDLLVRHNVHATDILREEVFPNMKKDAETIVVQSDELIAKYGSHFRFTHRTDKQIRYCSSRMRSLARLLLTMKDMKPDIKEFRDCITPKNFNVLVASIRRMSKFDHTTSHTAIPSIPPRLCSSLKACANIVLSEVIKNDTVSRQEKSEIVEEMKDFLHLMTRDWAFEVGTNSENSRKRMKVIKTDLLPETEDVRTFSQYIHDTCPEYMSTLKYITNVDNYERLAKLIIVHIISFNRRRPNETVEITLEAYQSTLNKRTDYGRDTQTVLSEEEQRSGETLAIFYTSANKNLSKVPVLMTRQFKEAVDVLIQSRESVGITSRFLFGRSGSMELFDGTAVLKEIAFKAGLKCPATFTANSLRHHSATSSQLRPYDDTFSKRMSKFMGHDRKTHERYYEMPLPIIQRCKVGHQLLKMITPVSRKETSPTPRTQTFPLPPPSRSGIPVAAGTSAKHRPSLPPHTITQDQTLEDVSTAFTDERESAACWNDQSSVPDQMHDISDGPMQLAPHTVTTSLVDRESCVETIEEAPTDLLDDAASTVVCEYSSDSEDLFQPSSKKSPKPKLCSRVRWTSPEKRVVYERFARYFVINKQPPRIEVKKVWEEEELLKNRKLQTVTTYINNIITEKVRIATPYRKKINNMVKNKNTSFSP